MAKIVKLVKTIRTNWKKSIVGFAAVSYGIVYAKNKYENTQYMRECCEEAAVYGRETIPVSVKPRKITVFLNPAANRRKAKKQFEDYCAPLLHLAGIAVNVINTEREGQVRTFLETFDEDTDAIIIAGGDGTLSEAITGLLRKSESSPNAKNYIVGVLPLGRTNTIATSLFAANGCNVEPIQLMTKAAMAIVNEVTKPIDVIKIELLEEDTPSKPIYSVSGIHWGAYRDANAKRDKYWYWNELRSYVTYIFTGLKDNATVTWKCDADLSYTLPCSGCSKCYKTLKYDFAPKTSTRWWHSFLPRASHTTTEPHVDYTKIVNEECGQMHHQPVSAVELALTTTNIYPNCPHKAKPHIEVSVGPDNIGYADFVKEGWKRVSGSEPTVNRKIAAREIELRPLVDTKQEGQERWMSIDLEDYEVKPVHLTLLPKRVKMFCVPENIDKK